MVVGENEAKECGRKYRKREGKKTRRESEIRGKKK